MGPSKRKQRFQGNRGNTPKRRQPSRATGNTDTDVTSASLAFDRAVFGAVWRYLRKEGWYHRQPTGLSELYRYVPPDGTPNGVAGVDFFLGEQALLEYYNRVMVAGGPDVDAATYKFDQSAACDISGDESTNGVMKFTVNVLHVITETQIQKIRKLSVDFMET
ncbi:hypothetical protein F444_14758 [Phytophthora nicotianae P1976]|uniref:Uncharacterized protein n=1 Tax=Phytophthora nicotianae P1976 TaxID=1317066 RepID=A0A080ZP25_PHYNI|nr:hypothetical protein F444_14758 [Phytophthora nicotianae P1976]